MKRTWLLGAMALGALACQSRDFTTSNRADVILRFDKIAGAAGGSATTTDVLLSDVLTCKDNTHSDCSVVNDNATLTLEVLGKNPTVALGAFDDVLLDSYKVQYFRTDGRNVEGVDVPFSISGAMATLVPHGSTAAASIVIVRHQAKEEPPLRNLLDTFGGGNGSVILTTVAQITVYGKTTSGKDVSASGSLEVTFSDFGP